MDDPRKAILGALTALDILTNAANFNDRAGIRSLDDQYANYQQMLDDWRLNQIERDAEITSRYFADRTTYTWRPR